VVLHGRRGQVLESKNSALSFIMKIIGSSLIAYGFIQEGMDPLFFHLATAALVEFGFALAFIYTSALSVAIWAVPGALLIYLSNRLPTKKDPTST